MLMVTPGIALNTSPTSSPGTIHSQLSCEAPMMCTAPHSAFMSSMPAAYSSSVGIGNGRIARNPSTTTSVTTTG